MAGLTIEGAPMTAGQKTQAQILLGVVNKLQAGQICAEAIICAAIGESTLTALSTPNNAGYWGVLQGGSGASGSSPNFPPPNGWNDSVGMATAFLQGGKGFGNGPGANGRGAIALVRAGWTDPGMIADSEEDGGAGPEFYGQHLADAKAIIGAYGGSTLKGGVAGGSSGSSGTVPDGSSSTTYAFSISGTDNPDEDYWTGINRLAQEVNWYLFSNGEYLYYMDGQEMLAQASALTLDRIKDSGQIYQSQGTGSWDNTSYNYVSDHKRRFHVQRKTKVAIAQSPTEGDFQLICGIDEIRGGDLIELANFGIMDGKWLVAECRRSVFQVYSELTLVPALAPITEAQAVGTTGTKSTGPTGATIQAGQKSPGTSKSGYTNPFPGGWQPTRLDMGYDGTFSGQIVAPFSGTITYASTSFSNWGGYVELKASGTIPGLTTDTLYFAEGLAPLVSNGQQVNAGTPIARPVPSIWNGITGNIEWGCAQSGKIGSPTDPLAEPGNLSDPRQMVLNFAAWTHDTLGVAHPATTDHAGYP